jgi:hypothetical protein
LVLVASPLSSQKPDVRACACKNRHFHLKSPNCFKSDRYDFTIDPIPISDRY